MHEGMGCSRPRMEPPMRVCAPRHPYTPRGTSAHALRHTLAWNLHVHPYAHTCTHTYTYTHGDTHLAVARSHCAAARAHTHANSCTSTRPARTLECILRAHLDVRANAHTHVHTTQYLYLYMDIDTDKAIDRHIYLYHACIHTYVPTYIHMSISI
jgi:hypothetical protein